MALRVNAASYRQPALPASETGAALRPTALLTLSLLVFGCSSAGSTSSDAHTGDATGGGGAGGVAVAGAGGVGGSKGVGATGGSGGAGGPGVGGSSGGPSGAAGSQPAGAGGGSGGAGAGSGSARIIRGDPNESTWFSLTIEGRGLTSDEGKFVTARIGFPDRPPERLGSARVQIQDGAFRIEFPQGCEGFLYKLKFLFIDVNGDGVCTPGVDRVYSDARFLASDITLTLSDSVPAAPTNTQMRLSSTDPPASSYCQALNDPWPDS